MMDSLVFRYVMFTKESPQMTDFVDFNAFANLFNATMSYRRDSTIYRPYGFLEYQGGQKDASIPKMLHEDLKTRDAVAPSWIHNSLLKKVTKV